MGSLKVPLEQLRPFSNLLFYFRDNCDIFFHEGVTVEQIQYSEPLIIYQFRSTLQS
jgi:hypothetical protein